MLVHRESLSIVSARSRLIICAGFGRTLAWSLTLIISLSDALGDGRMSSALLNGARRALAQRARTASARSFNTSAPKRGGGGGDEPVREATRGPGPLDIF